jgi:hypothetical protein
MLCNASMIGSRRAESGKASTLMARSFGSVFGCNPGGSSGGYSRLADSQVAAAIANDFYPDAMDVALAQACMARDVQNACPRLICVGRPLFMRLPFDALR